MAFELSEPRISWLEEGTVGTPTVTWGSNQYELWWLGPVTNLENIPSGPWEATQPLSSI